MFTEPGTARQEAERLVAAALAFASLAANSHPELATGSAACCVCPFCKLIEAVRDPDPHFVERLATGAGDLAVGVASLLRNLSPTATSTDPWRSATTAEEASTAEDATTGGEDEERPADGARPAPKAATPPKAGPAPAGDETGAPVTPVVKKAIAKKAIAKKAVAKKAVAKKAMAPKNVAPKKVAPPPDPAG